MFSDIQFMKKFIQLLALLVPLKAGLGPEFLFAISSSDQYYVRAVPPMAGEPRTLPIKNRDAQPTELRYALDSIDPIIGKCAEYPSSP